MVVIARSSGFICHVLASPRINCKMENGSVSIVENKNIIPICIHAKL